MNAKVLDENGKLQTVIMGCYGIGVSRVAAATVEQNNDENGIIWPRSIAPYEIDLIATNMKNEKIVEISEKIYEKLKVNNCLLYTSPSPRDVEESRMPSSAWKKKKK